MDIYMEHYLHIMESLNELKPQQHAGCGGACLWFQHSGNRGRGRWISLNSKPTWSIKWFPGLLLLLHKVTQYGKIISKQTKQVNKYTSIAKVWWKYVICYSESPPETTPALRCPRPSHPTLAHISCRSLLLHQKPHQNPDPPGKLTDHQPSPRTCPG